MSVLLCIVVFLENILNFSLLLQSDLHASVSGVKAKINFDLLKISLTLLSRDNKGWWWWGLGSIHLTHFYNHLFTKSIHIFLIFFLIFSEARIKKVRKSTLFGSIATILLTLLPLHLPLMCDIVFQADHFSLSVMHIKSHK